MSELNFIKSALNNPNVQAMLKTIRQCEGTNAPDGYNYLFGSSPHNDRRFDDLSTHPHIQEPFGTTTSSAAGAYQIMFPTWQNLSGKLGLHDFSPSTQDIMAVELMSMKNCVQKLIDGNFEYAVKCCNTTWASLPGSPYGQPTHNLSEVTAWFKANGGVIHDAIV